MRLRSRARLLVATVVAGSVFAGLGALAAPASARPDGFGTCHVNIVRADGNGDVSVDPSGRPIECYY